MKARLVQVGLADFKSFEGVQFFLGSLTLMVGTNASGKSNIRDALRVLHGIGQGFSLPEILGDKYGPGGILQWQGVRGGSKESARFGSDSFFVGTHFEITEEGSAPLVLYYGVEVDVTDARLGPRVVRESLWPATGFLFDTNPEADPLEQRGEHQLRVRIPRGGNNRRSGKVFEFASHTSALSQFPSRKAAPALLRRTCEALLQALRSMRFLDLEPNAMRIASQPGITVLGDHGENLSSVLQAICEDNARREALLGWVRSLTPLDVVDFDFKHDFTGKVMVHFEESSGALISAVSASDGTLRFLALVAALLSEDPGQLYFFEEFDNGIHPTRLHLLLELVQQACRTQDVQVVGTTHNPALLAFLDADAREHALLVYRPEGSSVSKVRRILDLPDVERILDTQDLGRLHATGWLEDAAAFSDPDEEDDGSEEESEAGDEE